MELSLFHIKRMAFRDLLSQGWTVERAATALDLSRATAYRYQSDMIREGLRVEADCHALQAMRDGH